MEADVDRIGTPDAVGIDETLAVRRGPFRTQEWLTGIIDVSAGRLLDVVEGRSSAGPIDWFNNQGAAGCSNVKWAALDMSGPYRRVYEIALPNATQVADPFHVVKLANLKLDLVRRRVQTEQLGHRGHKNDPLYRARKLLQIASERHRSQGPPRAPPGTAVGADAVALVRDEGPLTPAGPLRRVTSPRQLDRYLTELSRMWTWHLDFRPGATTVASDPRQTREASSARVFTGDSRSARNRRGAVAGRVGVLGDRGGAAVCAGVPAPTGPGARIGVGGMHRMGNLDTPCS